MKCCKARSCREDRPGNSESEADRGGVHCWVLYYIIRDLLSVIVACCRLLLHVISCCCMLSATCGSSLLLYSNQLFTCPGFPQDTLPTGLASSAVQSLSALQTMPSKTPTSASASSHSLPTMCSPINLAVQLPALYPPRPPALVHPARQQNILRSLKTLHSSPCLYQSHFSLPS